MRKLWLILILLLTQNTNAQTSTWTFSNTYTNNFHPYRYNNHLALFESTGDPDYVTHVLYLDLKTGNLKSITPYMMKFGSITQYQNHVYFIKTSFSGEYRYYTMMRLDLLNQRMDSVVMAENLIVSSPMPTYCLSENKSIFFIGFKNNQYSLNVSDSSLIGGRKIHSTSSQISNPFVYQNNPYFFVAKNRTYRIADSTGKESGPVFSRIPAMRKKGNDQIVFIDDRKVYRTTDMLQFDSFKCDAEPSFINDSMMTSLSGTYDSGNASKVYRAVPPYTSKFFASAPLLKKGTYMSRLMPIGQYRLIYTPWTGIELLHQNENKGLAFLGDFNPGIRHFVKENDEPDFTKYNYTEINDTFYFMGADHITDSVWLYKIFNDQFECLFPVKTYGRGSNIWTDDEFIYWTNQKSDSFQIHYRKKSDKDPVKSNSKQPDNRPEKNQEWQRSIISRYDWNYASNRNIEVVGRKILLSKDSNIFLYGTHPEGSIYNSLFFSNDSGSVRYKGHQFTACYNINGQRKWTKSFGSSFAYLNFSDGFAAIDRKGNIWVANFYRDSMRIDNQLINNPRQFGIYAICMDAHSGNTLKFVHFPGIPYDIFSELDGFNIDEEENLYFTFVFRNFNFSLNGFSIKSSLSPANALLCADTSGMVKWLKRIETPWKNNYGTVKSIKNFDGLIHVMVSQGGYNTFSSCRFRNWGNQLVVFDKSGEVKNQTHLEGDDLNSGIDFCKTNFNKLFISGFYRGNFKPGRSSISSPIDDPGDCSNLNAFTSTLSENLNPSELAFSTPLRNFFPLQTISKNNYIYVFGAYEKVPKSNRYYLSIIRYNQLGNIAALRILPIPCRSPFNWGTFNQFEVDEHSIYVVGNCFPLPQFNNYINDDQGISLYRLNLEKDWMEINSDAIPENIDEIILAPNPAGESIKILVHQTNVFKNYDIIDQTGRVVQSGALSGEREENINVALLATGVYHLILKGSDNHTITFIKQ